MKMVAIQPSEGDRDRAFAETQTVLKVYPNVKLIMAIAAPRKVRHRDLSIPCRRAVNRRPLSAFVWHLPLSGIHPKF